ncbi:hypothetical protein [Pseudodesulfovibrio piezophilus]|uniref:YtkA-like domain-containing protein n=1 Tax=Pseudodesulfovibrio piezophilus (strain DSM 21447 / JCM 15486 / C1TLV30) TaxID=1322246 RepID=M1WJS7_PSEP2|nr:hypothetical protein [Pseudodesulfovibrio piezophilus]CCH48416.1 conserved exported protein of unknown function [Pseudodesulfovibrio piezophilus C1TLV30]
MKKYDWIRRIAMTSGLLFLLFPLLISTNSFAQGDEQASPHPTMEIHGEMKTHSIITVFFDLKDSPISNGSYASVNVRTLEGPGKYEPEVKRGFPRTTLIFTAPGVYKIRFILNEVSKPSCGGVNARLLLETTRKMTITP